MTINCDENKIKNKEKETTKESKTRGKKFNFNKI